MVGVCNSLKFKEFNRGDNDMGYQELSDDEIISEVLGHADIKSEERWENDENNPPQHLVPSKDTLEALGICMRWMEQQEETTPQQVVLVSS